MFFFFKQKTAYEMRISDWSSDVCSSDLTALAVLDGSSLKQLVVGSVAGGLPAAKSLLYRLFRRGEVAALPDDPRITRFSALIANDGRPDPVAIDAESDVALIQYTGGTTGTPTGAKPSPQNTPATARPVNVINPDHGANARNLGGLPLFPFLAH